MALRLFDPFRDVLTLRDAMNRLFEESFVRPGSLLQNGRTLGLLVDVEESDDAYTITASLPGFRPEDVTVSVSGDTVTIQAQHREEQDQNRAYLLRERSVASLSRTITLPTRVDADKAQARYEHGELILTLPKAEEVKPKRIQVSTGTQELASQQQ